MKFEEIIDSGIPSLGGMLLLIIVVVTFMQIVLREFFDFSLSWSDDIAQFCMSWLTLVGSIWVTQNNRHLNTGLKLHQKLNEKITCLIDGLLALLIVIIAAVVAYQTVLLAFMAMGIESVSLRWLKMGYAYIAVPFFMLAVCYYYLKNFFENILRMFRKDK
jgi:TRAP-type C4-dicarboxylate transport system permease small subunit